MNKKHEVIINEILEEVKYYKSVAREYLDKALEANSKGDFTNADKYERIGTTFVTKSITLIDTLEAINKMGFDIVVPSRFLTD